MIKAEIIKLTREFATELLSNNPSNRPISEATVSRYERIIKRGEWALNGETITVFDNGALGDGQHRCAAVKRTGIAVDAILITGIDPATFPTINFGKPRGNADVLGIAGEVNTARLSAAARAYLVTQLVGRDIGAISSIQIRKCVEDHPHIRYWIKKYCTGKVKNYVPSSFCAYLALASEKYGFEKLDAFYEQVQTGVGLNANDPAFILRERFMSQGNTNKLSATHVRAFIVKAINAHLIGKKLTFLRFTEGNQCLQLYEPV